jgi:hypothetical protein
LTGAIWLGALAVGAFLGFKGKIAQKNSLNNIWHGRSGLVNAKIGWLS